MASQYEKRKAKAKAQSETEAKEAAMVEKLDALEAMAESVEELANFDGVAYDIIYDNEKKLYFRIEVEYDSKTSVARVKNIKVLTQSQPVAMQKMHELFTRKLLRLPYE